MAANSCRRPRLRYSMTLASPFMVQILFAAAPPPRGLPMRSNRSHVAGIARRGKRDTRDARSQSATFLKQNRRSGGRIARGVTGAPGRAGGGDRLVHDPPDGTDAPPALCAATKAAIDLAGARRIRRRHRGPHVTVTEHVAGADDHEK